MKSLVDSINESLVLEFSEKDYKEFYEVYILPVLKELNLEKKINKDEPIYDDKCVYVRLDNVTEKDAKDFVKNSELDLTPCKPHSKDVDLAYMNRTSRSSDIHVHVEFSEKYGVMVITSVIEDDFFK